MEGASYPSRLIEVAVMLARPAAGRSVLEENRREEIGCRNK